MNEFPEEKLKRFLKTFLDIFVLPTIIIMAIVNNHVVVFKIVAVWLIVVGSIFILMTCFSDFEKYDPPEQERRLPPPLVYTLIGLCFIVFGVMAYSAASFDFSNIWNLVPYQ